MSIEFHGARHRPGQAVAVAALLAAVSAGMFLLTAPLTAVILSLLLWASLADFFLPCRYQIGSELVVRKGLLRQTYAWSRFRSIHLDHTGVLLSPFRDRHKLESFRGVYLPMDRETARKMMPVLWEKLGMNLDLLAERITRRGLALPAILLLESSKPLSFLGNQLLVFCQPLAQLLGLAGAEYQLWLDLSADRANLEALVQRLEGTL